MLLLVSTLPYGRPVVCPSADGGHGHRHAGSATAGVATQGPDGGTAAPDCHRAMACGLSVVAIRPLRRPLAPAPEVRDASAAPSHEPHDRAIAPPLPPPPRA